MKFIKNEDIEFISEQRLEEYRIKTGMPITTPMPIEKIVGQLYGLTIDWDVIEEFPRETILGGLQPLKKTIVLNETHLSLFQEKPGLESSTIGHEAGHWEFHIDKSIIDHPKLFDKYTDNNIISHRKSSKSGIVEIFSTINLSQYIEGMQRKDSSDEERVANRFAACLMMPKKVLAESTKQHNLFKWEDLYSLASLFQVTISSLTTRLQQLKYIYIDSEKKIHKSQQEALGQLSLF